MSKLNIKSTKKLFDKIFRSFFLHKMGGGDAQCLKDNIIKPSCPACDGSNSIMFNWAYASEEKANDLTKYTQYLKHDMDLRIGQIYYCPHCEQRWYLDGEKVFMFIVSKDFLKYIYEWNNKVFELTNEQLAQLKIIGSTSNGIFENFISIPCEVTTQNGNIYKKSFITFHSKPPTSEYSWHFSDDIVSIRPSEYCLPQDVRLAASQAYEIRMGFAPTKVQDEQGNKYFLNGSIDFFDYKGIKGENIKLSGEKSDATIPIINETVAEIEYFIADYSESLEFLRVARNKS